MTTTENDGTVKLAPWRYEELLWCEQELDRIMHEKRVQATGQTSATAQALVACGYDVKVNFDRD